MKSRIIRLGLVAAAVVVAVVIVLNLRPLNKTAAQVASSPMPSPAPRTTPGKLAYSLNGDIYLANWDGSHPVRIVNGTPDPPTNGAYGNPIWSPDGRYLAYVGETPKGGGSFHNTLNISDPQGRLLVSFPCQSFDFA